MLMLTWAASRQREEGRLGTVGERGRAAGQPVSRTAVPYSRNGGRAIAELPAVEGTPLPRDVCLFTEAI